MSDSGDNPVAGDSDPRGSCSNLGVQTTFTRETTADSSVIDLSRQVPNETPGTSVEDLSDLKDPNPETTGAATVSGGLGGDGNEEKDDPACGTSAKTRRQSKARFEDPEESPSEEEPQDLNVSPAQGSARKYARALNTNDLYKTYLDKLHRQAIKTGEKKNQGSKLVKSFIDYVRVLEDRVGQLESKVPKESTEEQPTIKPEPEKEEPKKKDGDPERKWADVGLEVKFFNAEYEINLDGTYISGNTQKEGTYTCEIGPKHLIRVLYDWNEDLARNPPRLSDGEQPDPKQINLLAVGVTSEPIAKFFKRKLDLETDGTFLVRTSKPFRPLLRNLHPLEDQLAKLEDKLKAKEDEKPTPLSYDSSKAEQTSSAADGNPQPDDGLPFPPSQQGEEENTEEYDREEALEHFRILLQFVGKYLGAQVSLLERLKAGKEEKIAFENLWMLFNSGDTIYSPFHEGGQILQNNEDEKHVTKRRDVPQAYYILSTVGGVPHHKAFGRKPKGVTFDDMEYNSFSRDRGSQFFANELGMPASETVKNKYIPLYLYCFYIDFDGNRYGTVPEIFTFKPHEGEVDIRSLEAFPLHYLDAPLSGIGTQLKDADAQAGKDSTVAQSQQPVQDFLLERGKKFIDMTAVSHMAYEGPTIGDSREEINSEVIVDFKLAFQEYRQSSREIDSVLPTFTTLNGFWFDLKDNLTELISSFCDILWCHVTEHTQDRYVEQQKKQREKAETKFKVLLEEYEVDKTDHIQGLKRFKQYMEDSNLIRLLPGVVPGFALRNRRWIQVDLRLLQHVKMEDGWNDLVLPKGHREMVQAMVETHAKGTRSTTGHSHQDKVAMDLVRGKGKGCIILLHGAPGVGKTSTAECVAAYTSRPLYPITCGDIGYLPEAVEKNMEKHFKLAHKWGCVLLLDEADVFLAKRSKDDVKRNGLVSVFLRILEYYSGILFLTTNRVGAIDDAFRSRLHLTLYYPKLDKRQTIKIWKRNLKRMDAVNEEREKNGRLPIEFKADTIIKWVKKNWDLLRWNGRQIRNAFQTAIALGEFKARPDPSSPAQASVVDVKQFKIIAEASVQFNQYLQETHGLDEDKTAKRDMIRTEIEPSRVKFKRFDSSDDSDDSSDDSDEASEEESEESEKDKKKKKKNKKESESKSKTSKGEKSKDKKKK